MQKEEIARRLQDALDYLCLDYQATLVNKPSLAETDWYIEIDGLQFYPTTVEVRTIIGTEKKPGYGISVPRCIDNPGGPFLWDADPEEIHTTGNLQTACTLAIQEIVGRDISTYFQLQFLSVNDADT